MQCIRKTNYKINQLKRKPTDFEYNEDLQILMIKNRKISIGSHGLMHLNLKEEDLNGIQNLVK